MAELCFNCMNRSAYLLRGENPNLEGQFAAAAKAGFGLIGPDAYSIQDYFERGGHLQGLADCAADCGLRVFELPTLLVSEDVSTMRKEIDDLLSIARGLRPEFVQVNVNSPVDEVVLGEFRRAGELFLEVGARLAVEYLPWLPEIKNLEATRSLMTRAAIEGAGILVDSWHFFHSDDTWEDLEALPLEEISYVQFDDHPKLESDDLIAETLGRRVMPGEGCFELERFCNVIRAKGFDGVVSCEILSEETRHMDLDEFASRVYSSSRRYWASSPSSLGARDKRP